jgi:TolB-like protein/DNA-binding winged helix-turn-helix (wHTH) protein
MSAISKPPSVDAIRLAAEPDFVLGDLAIRPSVREVVRGAERHQVEPRVMQVLVALARANGAVVSRDELIHRCWDDRVVGEAAINRCIFKLRELADAGEGRASFHIETIARVGYRLEAVDGAGHALPPVIAPTPARPRVRAYAIGAIAALVLVVTAWLALRNKPASPIAPPAEASIAVLPFKNLSSEPDAAYFAAGIQDEILTRLAKIGSLKVISRTSAEQVAARQGTLKEMAHVLGVANIVEGSVQRADDTVRVNVQLIRVDTDQHLWAEDYDRKLGDVLSVENDIAGAIATALAGKITPSESAAIAMQPTLDRRAYDLYLRGLVLQRRFEAASNLQAVGVLEQAVAIDPSFAVAWALLARTHAFLVFDGDDMRTDHRAAARATLDKALALNAELAEVQLADATYKYYVDHDFAAAERAFKTVHARWPNNADALGSLGLIERRLGHWTESTTYFRECITLDPLVVANHTSLATTLSFRRDYTAAIAAVDAGLSLWPGNPELLMQKIDYLQATGALDRADAALAELHVADDDNSDLWFRRVQYAYRREFAEGQRYFEGVHASPRFAAWRPFQRGLAELLLADFRMHNGDADGARRGFQTALDLMLPTLAEHPGDDNVQEPVAIAYTGLGDKASAMRHADRIVGEHPLEKDPLDGFNGELIRAYVTSRLGERDVAIATLQKLLSETGPLTTTMLKLEPDFDLLRGDPRFERLIAAQMTPAKD